MNLRSRTLAIWIPAHRRKGIVDSLLETIIEKGKRQGFKRTQINIYIGNIAAQRAYEKHGFTFIDEKYDPYFEEQIALQAWHVFCLTTDV